ncbi:MAG: hypothetical protein OS112_03950 [Methanoregula sp.]|nr:MAG: hypothetical protein OS112_03950 [Methanoregula sp.]
MNTRQLFIPTFCCIDRPLAEALGILAGRTLHVEILSDGLSDLLPDPATAQSISYLSSIMNGEQ